MSETKDLLFTQKSLFDILSSEEITLADAYCEKYKSFLDNGKTERECVKETIKLAKANGFLELKPGMKLEAGQKIYTNVRNRAIFLAVIGHKPLDQGVNISAAHIDAPRLDLKQMPLYEDGEMALLKTHYYGGVKKYHWVAQPLALHGVVIKKDGTSVDIVIGKDETDPVFMVSDLLPHLGKDQMKKTLSEAFTGENLNILIGTRPTGEAGDKDRFKLSVLKILNEKYGITEEDFLSAEIQAVPAMNARDVGLDRSLIGAYGHDDRSCSFASLQALFDIGTPQMTAVCLLVDKEEVGSDGITGMQSAAFEDFMGELCDAFDIKLRDCFRASFCLSGDVCNANDPNFPEVTAKQNSARLGFGLGIMKYTGSGGKSGSSDAAAEVVAMLRDLFEKNNITWQMTTLGKVDQGGGGTVAKFMANRNIPTIDAGVPVLSMHAPYEMVSKLDCYMTYKAIKAVYER